MPIPQVVDPRAEEAIRSLRDNWKNRPRRDAFIRLAARFDLSLIVIFGSRVSGRIHPKSDIDLAVMPAPNASFDIVDFMGAVMELLGEDRVDVVDLRRSPPLLAKCIADEGVIVYEGKPLAWLNFRLKAMKEFDDYRRFRSLRRNSLDRRLRRWGLR